MSAPPNRTDLAGTPTVATYKIAIGLLYDYVAGLLGNGTATIATSAEQVKAREYLGVGATGFKNRLVNPEFMIDQENAGASVSVPVSASVKFVVDQWYALSTGATITAQQVTGISERQNSLRFTGAASNTGLTLGQRIEASSCADLKNQTVTVSLKAKVSNAKTVTWTASYANVADNFTAVTQIATGTFNATTSASDFNFNFNAGANAGNGLLITFSITSLLASETIEFDQAQFEKSSVATEFQGRPKQQELALCQRYYLYVGGDVASDFGFAIYASSASQTFYQSVSFPVVMRAAPTMTVGAMAASGATSFTVLAAGKASCTIQFTSTASGRVGVSSNVGVKSIVANARL